MIKFLVVRFCLGRGASPALAAEQLSGKFDTTSVAGGISRIQNIICLADTSQCISPEKDAGFISVSDSGGGAGLDNPFQGAKLDMPVCPEADGPERYHDGIQYTLNTLAKSDNVYAFSDVAYSGWLEWRNNFDRAVALVADVVTSAQKSWDGIAGFVWVKPPAESDGVSTSDLEPDRDDPAIQQVSMCDPKANSH